MQFKDEAEAAFPSQEKIEAAPATLVGDVIGDTVYSQRFVLKLLLKFANLDTYKEEVKDEDFETDLCTLWDMTTESDVVKFLLENDFYNLLQFVLPTTSDPRIIEILVGITGNMCCTRPSVVSLTNNKDLCSTLLAYSHIDDSLVLLQVMRLVNACLDYQKNDTLQVWLDMFRESEFPRALSFIMTYSANKDVLISTLGTLQCICLTCNIVVLENMFFELFVQEHIIEGLIVTFLELDKNKKDETLHQYFTMYLYIMGTLSGFNKSAITYCKHIAGTLDIIVAIFMHYIKKATIEHSMDDTLADVVDLTTIICSSLCLYSEQSMKQLLGYMFKLWLHSSSDHTKEFNISITKLNKNVCIFFAKYMESVTDEALMLHSSRDIKQEICAIMNDIKNLNLTNININKLEMRVKAVHKSDSS